MKSIFLQPYKKESPYSYTTGAFATFELLNARPGDARAVYIHPDYGSPEKLEALCREKNIPVFYGEKYFSRLKQKGNSYVCGVFEKNAQPLSGNAPHLLLINPADCGNIGTIIRTAAGLGMDDVGVVLPAGDVFHPKTVRASMGAVFRIRINTFASFEEYRREYASHFCYPFMTLDAASDIHTISGGIKKPYTLIFGSEAEGLDISFAGIGVPVRIPQSSKVDSLNIAVAVGIGLYAAAPPRG